MYFALELVSRKAQFPEDVTLLNDMKGLSHCKRRAKEAQEFDADMKAKKVINRTLFTVS